MDEPSGPKPLISGRGMLRIEDFCRSTGLARATVEELMRAGRLDGVLWTPEEPSHPVGIFDDVLPSSEALAALGLQASDDYDPDALRSFEMTDDEDAEGGA
ncbi:hypothetical protein [Nocardioides sp. zg-1228]|uniref:hypothetical protein n=1 Tax=Nocardioides sp. zg-1228 TaxID=2763008 RepID=UPI001642E621|nr:hypothetical protein [Nocardioides sp. zg-1228]MBC2932879.1 hypothetical protein [Nocardioides sp. zg-1228]QSF56913.1 hypothetical protein JX575_15155 [Nocardioides sp. zg-1228]